MKTLIESRPPNRQVPGLFLALLLVVYLLPLLSAGLICDDWGIANLGLTRSHFIDAYIDELGPFSNRPLAPAYYAVISHFKLSFAAYFATAVAQWALAIYIVAVVMARRLGPTVAFLFAPFALLPIFSTTILFSPAMQSIGAFSVLLWACSFFALDRAIERGSLVLSVFSAFIALCMLASYEVALPLFALSVFWPLICGGNWRRDRVFLCNLAGIAVAISLTLIYQKVIAPKFFEDLSRMRVHDIGSFAQQFANNIWMMAQIIIYRAPFFLGKSLWFMVSVEPWLEKILWVLAVALFWQVAREARAQGGAPLSHRKMILCVTAVGVGMAGVAFIHAVAMQSPSLRGYPNRGMAAGSVLFPLGIALILVHMRASKFMPVALFLFASYAASFIVQSAHYIEAERIRERIFAEITAENRREPFNIVLADIPEFLPRNFNHETIFSSGLADFRFFLSLQTGDALTGAILTKKKLCLPQTTARIEDWSITVDADMVLPLAHAVFYTYGGDGISSFMPIHSGGDLHSIIDPWKKDCK